MAEYSDTPALISGRSGGSEEAVLCGAAAPLSVAERHCRLHTSRSFFASTGPGYGRSGVRQWCARLIVIVATKQICMYAVSLTLQ